MVHLFLQEKGLLSLQSHRVARVTLILLLLQDHFASFSTNLLDILQRLGFAVHKQFARLMVVNIERNLYLVRLLRVNVHWWRN